MKIKQCSIYDKHNTVDRSEHKCSIHATPKSNKNVSHQKKLHQASPQNLKNKKWEPDQFALSGIPTTARLGASIITGHPHINLMKMGASTISLLGVSPNASMKYNGSQHDLLHLAQKMSFLVLSAAVECRRYVAPFLSY